MRTFLGISCAESVREALLPLREDLAASTALRPVDAENFHLTVQFLGEADPVDVRRLDEAFQSRLPTPGPLRLVVEGVGVFPDPGSPSVAWAGIESTDGLVTLREGVVGVTRDLGYEEDHHEFTPHVTLGRFNDGERDKDSVLEWIEEHGDSTVASFRAPELSLFKSERTSDGSIYSRLVSWPL